jgi:hypothetical protein
VQGEWSARRYLYARFAKVPGADLVSSSALSNPNRNLRNLSNLRILSLVLSYHRYAKHCRQKRSASGPSVS